MLWGTIGFAAVVLFEWRFWRILLRLCLYLASADSEEEWPAFLSGRSSIHSLIGVETLSGPYCTRYTYSYLQKGGNALTRYPTRVFLHPLHNDRTWLAGKVITLTPRLRSTKSYVLFYIYEHRAIILEVALGLRAIDTYTASSYHHLSLRRKFLNRHHIVVWMDS